MSNIIHNTLTARENHHPFSFVYTDEDQRLSDIDFTEADIYKWAIQMNDNSMYVLIEYDPPTWESLSSNSSGGGGSPSGIAGGDLSGNYPNPSVIDDSHDHTPGVTIPAYPTALPPNGPAFGDLTGSYPSPFLRNSGITAGTYTKLTINSKGIATSGNSLALSDIPDLPGSKITTGTINISRLPIGTTPGTVAAGDDPRFTPSGVVPTHTHIKANIVDFAHTHLIGDLPVASNGISSATSLVRADDSRLSDNRNPLPHNHVKAEITDFSHSHTIADLPVANANEVSTIKLVRADDPRLSDSRPPTPGTINFTDIAGNILVSQLTNIPLSNLPVMVGATNSASGVSGIVPTPVAGDHVKFLSGDGTFKSIPGGGDMLKSIYDTNNNGVVDLAETANVANSITWTNVSGKPTSFPTTNSLLTIDQNLNMNGYRISNMATPINNDEAATKFYVDNLFQIADYKASVRAATTSNIVLTGTQTIDGVSLVSGDRVLVKDQSIPANNGIYTVSSSTWSRSTDFNTITKVSTGIVIYVEEGTSNSKQIWALTTPGPVVLGTTDLSFESTSQNVTVTNPLVKTGQTISLQDSGVTPGTYTKVIVGSKGIVTSGSNITASDVPNLQSLNGVLTVSKGGTGATSVPEIRSGLRSVRTVTSTTATITNNDDVILIDSGIGNVTLNLPTVSSSTNLTFTFKKISSDSNTINISASGSEVIDGSPTKSISTQWAGVTIMSIGSYWVIIGSF